MTWFVGGWCVGWLGSVVLLVSMRGHKSPLSLMNRALLLFWLWPLFLAGYVVVQVRR